MMSQDLVYFLTIVTVGSLLGAILGLLLRRYRPSWCVSWGKSCIALPWWVFGYSAIFFLMLAAFQLPFGQPYLAIGFVAFAVLELVAMVFALLRRKNAPVACAAEPSSKRWMSN
jgi:hypothetical protein